MSENYDSQFLDDSTFQSLLVACLESLQRGEMIDRQALARDFPQYAPDVEQFLDDRDMLERVASDFHDVDTSSVALSVFEPTIDTQSGMTEYVPGDTIRYIGQYEILEEIARGGMGVVFTARQQKLGRIVALKMILAGKLADAADVQRFHREAKAAGRLKHPNIVPVHEIGEHEGRHYFTMDFVDGRSLAEEIREESLAPRRAAQILRTAAEAVQFAHEQGTVHRDLKPANVLLTGDDVPHITDFGLAKMLQSVDEESRAELTASGQILGTPSYMSPEQASGKQELVGPASDIYSLGSILYACLTGRAPFVADSPVDTLLQVMKKEPVSPRELTPSVPKDLETICLKCLTKEPHRRYGTAQELADDLNRFLEGRPVIARPIGAISKTARWCRRNKAVAALLCLLFSSMAVGTYVSASYAVDAVRHARNEARHRAQAETARKEAEAERREAEAAKYEAEQQRDKTEAARLKEQAAHAAAEAARMRTIAAMSAEAKARERAEQARRDAVRSLYVARTHLTRLLWERGNRWGASLPHVEQLFNDELTSADPDPELEVETLNQMIAANPSDDFLHFQRGIYYAKRHQWKEAFADLELCTNLTSQQYWYHCETASVALMVDDEEAYDRNVNALLKHLSDFEQENQILGGANVALIAALRPQSPKVLARLLPFTESWAAPGTRQFFRVKSLVLVRLRLEEFDAVLELLEPFAEEASFKRPEHAVLAGSIRALALHHLGRLKEAKQHLDRARQTYNDQLTSDSVTREGSFHDTHHPFIQAHVLLRQATEHITRRETRRG